MISPPSSPSWSSSVSETQKGSISGLSARSSHGTMCAARSGTHTRPTNSSGSLVSVPSSESHTERTTSGARSGRPSASSASSFCCACFARSLVDMGVGSSSFTGASPSTGALPSPKPTPMPAPMRAPKETPVSSTFPTAPPTTSLTFSTFWSKSHLDSCWSSLSWAGAGAGDSLALSTRTPRDGAVAGTGPRGVRGGSQRGSVSVSNQLGKAVAGRVCVWFRSGALAARSVPLCPMGTARASIPASDATKYGSSAPFSSRAGRSRAMYAWTRSS